MSLAGKIGHEEALKDGDRPEMSVIRTDRLARRALTVTCERFHELVPAYLRGRLPRRDQRRFELHRSDCRDCRAHFHHSAVTLRDDLAREWDRRDAARL